MTRRSVTKAELRTIPNAHIVARCMDCHRMFEGYVGVTFFEHEGVTGLEICVCAGEECHTITRIQVSHIPHEGAMNGNSPAAS